MTQRKNSLRGAILALAVLYCFVVASPMQASLINPPDPFPHPPDAFVNCTGCTFLASMGPQTVNGTDINGTIHWSAILRTAVFSDPGTGGNPFGSVANPTLDFFYQLTNLSSCAGCTTAPADIGMFTAGSFLPSMIPGTLLIDVGINFGAVPGFDPTGTALPGTVDRFAPGDTIGWSYTSAGSVNLSPGSTSIIMEVATNAKFFDANGFAGASNGGIAGFHAFEPAAASGVPEPASAALIGLGMLAIGTLCRRSRRTS